MTRTPPVAPPPVKGGASWNEVLAYPLACAGAMAGAGVGGFLAALASHAGFYAIILVGVLAGFGAVLVGRKRDVVIGIMAAVIALVGSLLTEWWLYPFVADDSLGYFVQHIGSLPAFSLLVHGLGAGCAGCIGWRR